MHNFLTYDEVEVFPGPKLNVLLGPNGTGKSAITHAICLACAGKPILLARSKDLAQFVKRGKEADPSGSFVEIDILLNKGEMKNCFIATIRRTLSTSNGSSKYLLNRRNTTERDINTLMASLNIDIGNLCSFMPQDRVGKFSAYSPKEMLQNTLRSIACSKTIAGGAMVCTKSDTNDNSCSTSENNDDDEEGDDSDHTNLYEVQMLLAREEKTKISLENDRAVKETEVRKCQNDVDHLEPSVRAAEIRQKLIDIRELYDVKRSIVAILEAGAERKKKQILVEEADEAVAAAEREIAPLVARERDCRRAVTIKEKEFSAVDVQYRRAIKTLGDTRDEAMKCDNETNALQLELRQMEANISALTRQLEGARGDEMRIREQFEQANRALESQNVDVKIKALLDKINGPLAQKQKEAEELLLEHQSNKDDMCGKHDVLRRQMNSIQDPVKIWQNEILRNNQSKPELKGVLQMMQFLRDNDAQFRQEGKLQGAVYGPVAFHCNVSDPVCGIMLENTVNIYKWMQFVVTNDHDGNFLKQMLRQRNVRADVAVVTPSRSAEVQQRLQQGRDELDSRGDFVRQLGIKGLVSKTQWLCLHVVHLHI